jgi:hypothetical protein
VAIAFLCPHCSKHYERDDALAGRRVRCKQCGTEFRVPSPSRLQTSPKSAPVGPSPVDAYGLDEEPMSRPSSVSAFESETGIEEEAVVPRRRAAPAGKKTRQGVQTGREGFASAARWCLILGVGSFVLPAIGLQFRMINFLPPSVQMMVGVMLILQAGLSSLVAFTQTPRFVAQSGVGLFGVATLLLVIQALDHGELPAVAMRGAAQRPGPVPPPALVGNLPSAIPAKPAVVSAPALGDPVPNVKVVLSNALVKQTTGGVGEALPGVSFRVDYRFEGRRPIGAIRYLWIIKSANRGLATDPVLPLDQQGTLTGMTPTMSKDSGPFETFIEAEIPAPGGPRRQKVSDTVSLQWVEGDWPDATQPETAPGPGSGSPFPRRPSVRPGGPPFARPGGPFGRPGGPFGRPGGPPFGRPGGPPVGAPGGPPVGGPP